METRNRATSWYDSEVDLVQPYEMRGGLLCILDGTPWLELDDQVEHHLMANTLPRVFGHTPRSVPTSMFAVRENVIEDNVYSGTTGGKQVAIKTGKSVDIAREVAIMSVMSHPNIVTLLGYSADRLYMELCDSSLEKGLRGIHMDDAVSQLVAGVKYLHSMDILHGDLKPENILVCGGTLKIADYGLSEMGIPRAVACWKYTENYRPPELMAMYLATGRGVEDDKVREVLDHTPDVYALGLVLYFVVTGKELFKRMSIEQILGAQFGLDRRCFIMNEADKKWDKYFAHATRLACGVTVGNIPHREKIMGMLRNSPSSRVY